MADNPLRIEFKECEPAPPNGYRVIYRPEGSSEDFRVWPSNFLTSPALFTDTQDPLGTQYEGFIMGDCGDGMYGVQVPWSTGSNSPDGGGGEESEPVEELMIINDGGLSITGVFTIPVDGEPGDSREVTCDEGYPLAPGQQSNGSIHSDHNGDNNLSVLVFFGSVATTFDIVRVVDSDNTEGCNNGNGLAAVISVTGPFRLNNSEGWTIRAEVGSC